jgi:hypothetical protein
LENYEAGFPPGFPGTTKIINYIHIENTISVDETNMLFSLTLDIISIWMDSRLAYSNSISTSASLDVTSSISRIWKPQIQISDNVKDLGNKEV